MENVTGPNLQFVLLGIKEMNGLAYVYGAFSFMVYSIVMLLSVMIVFTVVTEQSLHEPMYIFISNLTINGIFGSSTFLPKLTHDLLSSTVVVSREACLIQSFCILLFAYSEISTFTIMAYDRYLAVCHPLQYVVLMTNEKALKYMVGLLIFVFWSVLVAVVMTARLPLCGNQIKNIICDNMSIFILSCVDYSLNNLYGAVFSVLFLAVTILVISYCYLKIFIVCVRVTKSTHQKAAHTLMTHLINFSIFMVGFLFNLIRYRLVNGHLPLVTNAFLSITCMLFPPFLNPLIYGLRTRALKAKLMQRLEKFENLTELCKYKRRN